ncbi:hypothetical protein KDH_43550 [Dictyobacter sp. S3.2.2.5]|uniref:Uncharacterized protein n=1 Tax=Dictyobacter halimunensis TaxID=3026934 RepID=A0ABQ6FTD1_9CHLR|nr:hypothetical protein KDH_43550 [Dictyobacter sp. S3.2.2.5]
MLFTQAHLLLTSCSFKTSSRLRQIMKLMQLSSISQLVSQPPLVPSFQNAFTSVVPMLTALWAILASAIQPPVLHSHFGTSPLM